MIRYATQKDENAIYELLCELEGMSLDKEGFHEAYGGLHAERNALKSCTKDPNGAELYVTLEPCCHYGRTPPCTEAVIKSGIRKVKRHLFLLYYPRYALCGAEICYDTGWEDCSQDR